MPAINEQAMMAAMQQGMAGGMEPPMPEPAAVAEGVKQPPEAEEGRGEDSIIAHLTPGEVVVPAEILSIPANKRAIEKIFKTGRLDIAAYIVGDEANSINPETGYPEFRWNPIKKLKSFARKIGDELAKPVTRRAEKGAREEATKVADKAKANIEKQLQRYQNEIGKRIKEETARGEAAKKEYKAQSMIATKKFEKVLSDQRKATQGISTDAGDVAGGEGTKDMSSAVLKRRRKTKSAIRKTQRPR